MWLSAEVKCKEQKVEEEVDDVEEELEEELYNVQEAKEKESEPKVSVITMNYIIVALHFSWT